MISYKLIEHERFEDAPFVGALISAIDCNMNCKNCFNQWLKEEPIIHDLSLNIISQIKQNKFNKGVIFGGLEWSLQPDDLYNLAKLSIENDLEVIIYTGLYEYDFFKRVPKLKNLSGFYVKFGQFKEGLMVEDNIQYGVKLASSNQYIKKF